MSNRGAEKVLSKLESVTDAAALNYDDFIDYFEGIHEDSTEFKEKENVRNVLKLAITLKKYNYDQIAFSEEELLKKSSLDMVRDQEACVDHEQKLISRYEAESALMGEAIDALTKALEESDTDVTAARLVPVRNDYKEHMEIMERIFGVIFERDCGEALEVFEDLLNNLFSNHNKYLDLSDISNSKKILKKLAESNLLEYHPSDPQKVRLKRSL